MVRARLLSRLDSREGGTEEQASLWCVLRRATAILVPEEPPARLIRAVCLEIRERLLLLRGMPAPTIVRVTHDQDEALRLADRVALLAGGRLTRVGTVAEMLQHHGMLPATSSE